MKKRFIKDKKLYAKSALVKGIKTALTEKPI